MTISEAAERTGLPVKTIRYYEEIGLLRPSRKANGYRDYGDDDLSRLRFVARARTAGCSINEARVLLSVYDGAALSDAETDALVQRTISVIERKLIELQSFKKTLQRLVSGASRRDQTADPTADFAQGNLAK